MHEFFQSNRRAIDALTIKDVIYGEIEDSVQKVTDIEDLLSINQVEFKVLSGEDVLGKAAELGRLVDRLKQEPEAWRDERRIDFDFRGRFGRCRCRRVCNQRNGNGMGHGAQCCAAGRLLP